MAEVIKMPKMSDTMEEGVIANWLKKVGDQVESGDIIAEVETDKATMELESYEDGTLLYIGVDEGGSVPIDGVIAVIGEEGADYEKLLKAQKPSSNGRSAEKEEKKPSSPTSSGNGSEGKDVATATSSSAENGSTSSSNGRVKASPLAKKMAQEMGYDLSKIAGSGERTNSKARR